MAKLSRWSKYNECPNCGYTYEYCHGREEVIQGEQEFLEFDQELTYEVEEFNNEGYEVKNIKKTRLVGCPECKMVHYK